MLAGGGGGGQALGPGEGCGEQALDLVDGQRDHARVLWRCLARRDGRRGLGTGAVPDLPRTFRTADLWLIHAADCCSMNSSWACCGLRYWSPECLRFGLYQNSMYLTTSRRACSRVGYWVR